MPQMAPLWWTTLYLLFILMLMMFYMLIYFNTKYTTMKSSHKMTQIKINWTW